MINWTRKKQPSYNIWLTKEQAESLQEMLMAYQPSPTGTVLDASHRIETKRKVRVLIDAIRRKEINV